MIDIENWVLIQGGEMSAARQEEAISKRALVQGERVLVLLYIARGVVAWVEISEGFDVVQERPGPRT